MRVLVCGGREFMDRAWLFRELDALHSSRGVTIIISGCAHGADTLGIEWAEERGIEVARFSADWNTHGRAAGPIRNQQMLDEGKPHLLMAFPGGRGSADMVRRARAAGIELMLL
jgi:YspA, cpYpsA-related SLOG family